MYTITRLHKLPKLKDIDIRFFFDEYKVKNDFFYENPLFLSLKETNCKNFDAAIADSNYICVRDYTRKSSYTIPSFFVRSKDENEIKKIIRNEFLKNRYIKIPKKIENSISMVFDKMKEEGLDYKKYRKTIIDYFYLKDLNKKEALIHYRQIKHLILKNMTAEDILDHFEFIKKEKSRIKRELIEKNGQKVYLLFKEKIIEKIESLPILKKIKDKEFYKNEIENIILNITQKQKK